MAFDDADDPTTEFIRSELKRLEQTDRGALFALEKNSGIGSGYISKIKNDELRTMHVGMTFVRKIAPSLGYKDLGDFFAAVGAWWNKVGREEFQAWRNAGAAIKDPVSIEDPELRLAVEMARGVASTEIISRVLRTRADQIGKRDRWFWINEMTHEAKIDFEEMKRANEAGRLKRKTSREKHKAPASSRSSLPVDNGDEPEERVANAKRRR